MDIEIGDRVRLVIGGPIMHVYQVDDPTDIHCSWSLDVEDEYDTCGTCGIFPADSLILIEKIPKIHLEEPK